MNGFEKLRAAHVEAGGCDCWDHLREAGLTPPRRLYGTVRDAPVLTPGAHGLATIDAVAKVWIDDEAVAS